MSKVFTKNEKKLAEKRNIGSAVVTIVLRSALDLCIPIHFTFYVLSYVLFHLMAQSTGLKNCVNGNV